MLQTIAILHLAFVAVCGLILVVPLKYRYLPLEEE